MRKTFIGVAVFLMAASLAPADAPRGTLFMIGGGRRPADMMKEFIRLAEAGGSGRIVVLPMANSLPEEVGSELVRQLEELGAKDVACLNLSREQALNPESARLFKGVNGIFFPGGSQSRLLKVLFGTPVHDKLMQLYRNGAVVGGTSAGAAVMSGIMITGEEKREVEAGGEFSTIEPCNVFTLPGLAFIHEALIDQHFIRRRRHNRLISLVVENPRLLGIGIDESTAVVVGPGSKFRVVGEGNVVIYDASPADIIKTTGAPMSCHGMLMHLLKPGDRFDLDARKVLQ